MSRSPLLQSLWEVSVLACSCLWFCLFETKPDNRIELWQSRSMLVWNRLEPKKRGRLKTQNSFRPTGKNLVVLSTQWTDGFFCILCAGLVLARKSPSLSVGGQDLTSVRSERSGRSERLKKFRRLFTEIQDKDRIAARRHKETCRQNGRHFATHSKR